MNEKLKVQLIRQKLDREAVYKVSISEFSDENILIDKLAGLLLDKNCIVILNGEGICDRYFLEVGGKIKQLCAELDGTLIIHARADLALLLDADGLLLDNNSITLKQAHSIIEQNTLLGVCTKTDEIGVDFKVSEEGLTITDLKKIIKMEELK